jgi:hypothetical protein
MTGYLILAAYAAVIAVGVRLTAWSLRRLDRHWPAQTRDDATWGPAAASSRDHVAGELQLPAHRPRGAAPAGDTTADAPAPERWASAVASREVRRG